MMTRRIILMVMVVGLLLALGGGVASAQQDRDRDVRNPWSYGYDRTVEEKLKLEPPTRVFALVYTTVATIGVCAVGLKNSKRTHLD